MPSKRPKHIKELYFYREKGKKTYNVDFINSKNKLVSRFFSEMNKLEIDTLVKDIKEGSNPLLAPSKKGFKVYSKKPKTLLNRKSEKIVNIYMENLNENRKLANLLHSVADLVDDDSEEEKGIGSDEPIDEEMPFVAFDYVQSKLDVGIDLNDGTFWYDQQKFVLHKDIKEVNVPNTKRPGASNRITSTLQHIINRLGVAGEMGNEQFNHYFRFVLGNEVYRVTYIYTGDHNTVGRDLD